MWDSEKSINLEVRAIWIEIPTSPPPCPVILGMLPNLCECRYPHGDEIRSCIVHLCVCFD